MFVLIDVLLILFCSYLHINLVINRFILVRSGLNMQMSNDL